MIVCHRKMIQFPPEEVKRGEKIGRGSYWKVYEGRLHDQRCAVKCFKPALKNDEGDKLSLQANILLECSKWFSLDNKNIVKFFGITYYEEKMLIPSLILEYMDKSLLDHLRNTMAHKQFFPLHTKLSILGQVSRGLNYLHDEKGLVHGDLTASNVLLREERAGFFTSKLTDFGMSRAVDGFDMTVSSTYGTLNYMPPEVLNASRPTFKIDIYSLGVLAVHMITHKFPRPSYALIFNDSRVPIAVSEFKRYSHLLLDVTESEKLLLPLIESCLQYDPEDRPLATGIMTQIDGIISKLPPSPPPTQDSTHSSKQDVYFTGPAIIGSTITNSIINLNMGSGPATQVRSLRLKYMTLYVVLGI